MDVAVEADADVDQYTARHFSLLNTLLTIVNATEADDPRHVIAEYLLENLDHLDRLNVYDMAADCFTSRSGIRRFCESILYKNFSDLKAASSEWELQKEYFSQYAEQPAFRADLTGGIERMLTSINALVSDERLDELSARIRDAGAVVFVSSSFSAPAVQDFQRALLVTRRPSHVVTDSVGSESHLERLTSGDLVVVVSATGVYGRVVSRQLAASPAHRVLVTLNRGAEFARPYDTVFHLADDEEHCGQRGVFAKYAVEYFFDLLYNRYHRLAA